MQFLRRIQYYHRIAFLVLQQLERNFQYRAFPDEILCLRKILY